MCLENAFQISEVVRPSLHEELIKGEVQAAAVAGARVFVAAASEAPPKQRLLREGAVQEVSTRSCDEAMGDAWTCWKWWFLLVIIGPWIHHDWYDWEICRDCF